MKRLFVVLLLLVTMCGATNVSSYLSGHHHSTDPNTSKNPFWKSPPLAGSMTIKGVLVQMPDNGGSSPIHNCSTSPQIKVGYGTTFATVTLANDAWNDEASVNVSVPSTNNLIMSYVGGSGCDTNDAQMEVAVLYETVSTAVDPFLGNAYAEHDVNLYANHGVQLVQAIGTYLGATGRNPTFNSQMWQVDNNGPMTGCTGTMNQAFRVNPNGGLHTSGIANTVTSTLGTWNDTQTTTGWFGQAFVWPSFGTCNAQTVNYNAPFDYTLDDVAGPYLYGVYFDAANDVNSNNVTIATLPKFNAATNLNLFGVWWRWFSDSFNTCTTWPGLVITDGVSTKTVTMDTSTGGWATWTPVVGLSNANHIQIKFVHGTGCSFDNNGYPRGLQINYTFTKS